ncbi:hypothetical protein vBCtySFA88_00084 [Clostridium phage vB_CtyS-FA88]|nr:hypothetical protein vBCtySFA88_00084 [Clostridium phage vB_CtyS-FA88]
MDNSNFRPLAYRAMLIAQDKESGMLRKEIQRCILFKANDGDFAVTIKCELLDKYSGKALGQVMRWLIHEGFNVIHDEIKRNLIITWDNPIC